MAAPAGTNRAAGDALIVRNLERQRELYGEELGEKVRRLQAALGVSQARLARSLGVSAAMLSQLVSGRRAKIGDPGVLARLLHLDRQAYRSGALDPGRVEELLTRVREQRATGLPVTGGHPAEALRGVASPTQLAAAANILGPRFPAIAELLRRAAERR